MSVHTIREFEFPAPQGRERRMRARRRRRNRRILITLMATLFVAGGLTGLMFFANRQIIPSGPLSTDAALPEPLFGRAGRTIDGVPFYSQIGEFPTGCEGVSAAMLLGYYGMDVAPGEFIDGFLPLGDAPYETAASGPAATRGRPFPATRARSTAGAATRPSSRARSTRSSAIRNTAPNASPAFRWTASAPNTSTTATRCWSGPRSTWTRRTPASHGSCPRPDRKSRGSARCTASC